MSFSFDLIRDRVFNISNRIEEIGGQVQEVLINDPATEEQIAMVERELGVILPDSFRLVLLNFTAEFSFRWFLPDKFELPYKYREIFGGTPQWSLSRLVEFEEDRKRWIESVFPNQEDEYDSVWHNKLAFLEVGNGDYFAFDISDEGQEKIVYLSHDDGVGHGYVIANSFLELVDSWSRICFVGAEDWQWVPFVESKTSGILPDDDSAIEFRAFIGIDI